MKLLVTGGCGFIGSNFIRFLLTSPEVPSDVKVVQNRQGAMVACPEETAFKMGYISREQLRKIAEPLRKSGYGEYLLSLL